MTKRAKTIIIICWSVVFVTLAGLAVWLITGNLFGIDTGHGITFGGFDSSGEYELRGEYAVPAAGIDAISAEWVSGTVDITPYDGGDIILREYARRELKDDEKLGYSVKNGSLSVKFYSGVRIGISFNSPGKSLEILIPKELAEKLGKLGVEAVSADVTLSGITCGELKLTSVSGDHKVSGAFGTISAETVSGDINVTSSVLPASFKSESVSGNVTLEIPSAESIKVRHSTVSGDFESAVPVLTVKSGADFVFESVSGDVRIELLR
jgi:hypothetical protein